MCVAITCICIGVRVCVGVGVSLCRCTSDLFVNELKTIVWISTG